MIRRMNIRFVSMLIMRTNDHDHENDDDKDNGHVNENDK